MAHNGWISQTGSNGQPYTTIKPFQMNKVSIIVNKNKLSFMINKEPLRPAFISRDFQKGKLTPFVYLAANSERVDILPGSIHVSDL
jgi:hypothetical protein